MLGKLFRRKRRSKRTIVVGIDGVPHSFIVKHARNGDFPNLARMIDGSRAYRMNSVYPTVSSCAWSSYMTGENPGGNGIFGFVDRRPNPFSIFIPNAKHQRAKTIWEKLSDLGKRVIVINVPVTYPPKEVNGILIGGFLGTDIGKIGYPPTINRKLAQMGYRIDAEARLGHTDKMRFLDDIDLVLEKRIEVANHLMESEDWDFFQLHIMETDRMNHFFWQYYEDGEPNYSVRFMEFYRRIDRYLEEIWEKFGDDEQINLFVLSDHGFCSLKTEFYLNLWLEHNGYLKFNSDSERTLEKMSSETKAYSLIPGRVYINLKGREQMGSVDRSDYEPLREELAAKMIEEIKDPETGDRIISAIYKREEIYRGAYLEEAADLIVVPKDGYEMKGKLTADSLTGRSEIVGVHTYDDAFLLVKGNVEIDESDEMWIGKVHEIVMSASI